MHASSTAAELQQSHGELPVVTIIHLLCLTQVRPISGPVSSPTHSCFEQCKTVLVIRGPRLGLALARPLHESSPSRSSCRPLCYLDFLSWPRNLPSEHTKTCWDRSRGQIGIDHVARNVLHESSPSRSSCRPFLALQAWTPLTRANGPCIVHRGLFPRPQIALLGWGRNIHE